MAQWIVWLLFGALLCNFAIINCLVRTTRQGKLIGTTLQSRNGTKFYAFFGIPYAKPPIGDLRFEAPQEPDSWNGVRNATVPPASCLQRNVFGDINSEPDGSEDCLYLNVYTPSTKYEINLPVMVYIHGGYFLIGEGRKYSPNYFLDYPVVVVNFNYRLGPLGFLSAVDEVLPGNYGMKDQTAALKWVQQNIIAFGGDPKRVTIFGHSAGGASVHFHLYSPLSKGLFQQAIAQSGSALAIWAQLSPHVARQRAFTFGLLSGCPTQTTRDLIYCLKKIPGEELLHTLDKFWVWHFDPVVSFLPVIEPRSVNNAFLLENPWKQKVVNNVPLIIGITSGEGGIRAASYLSNNGTIVKKLNKIYNRIFPVLMGYGFALPQEKIENVTQEIKKFYFGDKEIGLETPKELVDVFTDGLFAFDCMEAALRHTEETYFYYYDHRNKFSMNDVHGNYPGDLGVCHGDDIMSFFPNFDPLLGNELDVSVSERLIKYWINFAENGNPNGNEKILWQPMTPDEFEYLRITTEEDKLETNLLKDKYEFWKKLEVIHSHSAEVLSTFKDEL